MSAQLNERLRDLWDDVFLFPCLPRVEITLSLRVVTVVIDGVNGTLMGAIRILKEFTSCRCLTLSTGGIV